MRSMDFVEDLVGTEASAVYIQKCMYLLIHQIPNEILIKRCREQTLDFLTLVIPKGFANQI